MTTISRLKQCLENIKYENKEINAILEMRDEKELIREAEEIDKKIKEKKAGVLAGKIICVKANICIEGMHTSCASKVLENYTATYDATVIKKIKQEDGLIIGYCNQDEFACGGSGETSAFDPTKNPINKKLITGGSSSGSAAAVAADFCDIALGSDTGGSIRNPASFCGIVGLKPTYGSVSRYGLIDLSMSLDQIGPIAKNVEDTALMLSVIRGKDEFDSISEESKKINLENINKTPKKLKVGILDFEISDKRISELIEKKVKEIAKKNNWEIKKIKIPYLDLAVETYYPLVYVEIFSGSRKFDGRRYGEKIEDFAGPEVLRRILGGSEITKSEYGGRYYNKALKAKEIIKEEFAKVFKDVDCVISATVPRLPWKIGESISVEDGYAADALTIPANLAEICAASIPVGEIEKIPVGMQIMCNKFEDEKLLAICKAFQD